MAGVKTTHPDYDNFAPKWQRCRDVIAGQDAMQAAKQRYLPKLNAEKDSDYDCRIKRSDFFNGTWRTIDALTGLAFRKPPTFEVPANIEPMLDDINLAGKSMEAFAKEILEENLSVGRVGILVDHPAPPENVTALTQAVAEKLGLRPTLQFYTTESIRNWKFARINNSWVLSMVVLGEKQPEPGKDEFSQTTIDVYRVLDLGGGNGTYRQRLFMVNDKGEDVLLSETVPLMNGQPLDYIPFAILGPCGRGDDIDEPPLIDLVDKNVAHYQVNSDYRHGLHFTGLPTLFLAGVQQEDGADPIYIGGSAAITSPDPNARGEYLEFSGQGLQPATAALDRIERQMALLGVRAIADETQQVETLGATQIKRQGENSVLSKIVQAVSEALEWSLGIFAKWAGADGTVVYQLNRDFLPAMMDAPTLLAIFAGVQSGNISKQEAFALLQRGDVIDGEVDYEEHQAQIDASPPVPKPAPAAPAKPGAAAA